jgi:uncharacterized protein with gpF-like domain
VDSVYTSAVQKAIQAYAFEQAGLVTDTTKGAMKGLLQDAIDQGWGVKQLGQEIGTYFNDAPPYRSLATARTELTTVINDGVTQTISAQGYPGKEWLTVMDGHERDAHATANGQIVPIEQPFKVGGSTAMYPGDPNLPPELLINCRCSLGASGMPENRKRKAITLFLRAHGAIEKNFVVSLRREFDRQGRRILAHFPS